MAKRKYYKLNERIKYPEVRVIVPGGENVGVMKTSDAVRMAREQDLDLVVITEGAKPPVAKILDFNKFLYEENKKSSKTKAKSKKSETKQLRIGAKIDDSMIEVKANRLREFIEDGHRVKITVTLRGREKAHPELGMEKIDKFIEVLADIARPEGDVKRTVGSITITLVKK